MATTTQPSECPILNARILLTINGYRVGNSYIVLELSRIISSLEPGFTIISISSGDNLHNLSCTGYSTMSVAYFTAYIIKKLYREVTSYVKLFTILIFIFKIYLVLLYISYTDKKIYLFSSWAFKPKIHHETL